MPTYLNRSNQLFLISACFFFLFSAPVFADAEEGSSKQVPSIHQKVQLYPTTKLVAQLISQTEALERQVNNLQHQVNRLQSKRSVRTSNVNSSNKSSHVANSNAQAQDRPTPLGKTSFIGGTPVVTSPYIGVVPSYDASDLLVNFPYVNEDLSLLKQQQRIYSYCSTCSIHPESPLLALSGKIEAQISRVSHTGTAYGESDHDVDLTGAEVDTAVLVNQWSTGYLAFVYDNSQGSSNRRVDNSRVLLDRGFLTIGNLNQLPFYFTLGQYYVPFGQYASAMISDPLTKVLGRVKARAFTLGFYKKFDKNNELNLSAFAFNGDTKSSANSKSHQFGLNADYQFTQNPWSLELGTSYISNIADSGGMQHNGLSSGNSFSGFAGSAASEILDPIPGVGLRTNLGVGSFHFIFAYVAAARSFPLSVLSFDQKPARPQAVHSELDYNFSAFNKPSLIGFAYDQSKDALALLIPKRQYTAIVSTSIWKDTIESLQFSHAVDYPTSDQANGNAGVVPIYGGTSSDINSIILQVGFYF